MPWGDAALGGALHNIEGIRLASEVADRRA
jgi:hypothetical protein